MGGQIQLRIKRIDPAPGRIGIGRAVDPDFAKNGHIGRALGFDPFVGQGCPVFTPHRITRFIACTGQGDKRFQTLAAHLLKAAKHLLLDGVKLFFVNRAHNIFLQLGKGGIQIFKQGFFFLNCAHDRTPLEG